MTIDARKEIIVRKLQYVNESWLIKSIEKLLSDIRADDKEPPIISYVKEPSYAYYVGHLDDEFDLEKVKVERPRKAFDKVAFAKSAAAVRWDKSVAELLAELK